MVGQGSMMRRDQSVAESTAVKIDDTAPNEELVNALTSDEGPLASGTLPEVLGVSAEGQKALAEALTTHECKAQVKAKAKAKAKPEPATLITPKEPKEQLEIKAPDVLKVATDARRIALSLSGLNYSGELAKDLMSFSKRLEDLFAKAQKILSDKDASSSDFMELLGTIDEEETWYRQAEACGSFCLKRNGLFLLGRLLPTVHFNRGTSNQDVNV